MRDTIAWKEISSAYLGLSALLVRLHRASYFFRPSRHPYLVRVKSTFNNIISKRLWGEGRAVQKPRKPASTSKGTPIKPHQATAKRKLRLSSSCVRNPRPKPRSCAIFDDPAVSTDAGFWAAAPRQAPGGSEGPAEAGRGGGPRGCAAAGGAPTCPAPAAPALTRPLTTAHSPADPGGALPRQPAHGRLGAAPPFPGRRSALGSRLRLPPPPRGRAPARLLAGPPARPTRGGDRPLTAPAASPPTRLPRGGPGPAALRPAPRKCRRRPPPLPVRGGGGRRRRRRGGWPGLRPCSAGTSPRG